MLMKANPHGLLWIKKCCFEFSRFFCSHELKNEEVGRAAAALSILEPKQTKGAEKTAKTRRLFFEA